MKQSYLKYIEKSWPSNLKLLSDCYVSTYYSTSACQFVAHQQVAALVQDDM